MYRNAVREPRMYHWRDSGGHEIDCLLDQGSVVVPIEIKSARTFSPAFCRDLDYYCRLNPLAPGGVVIYGGGQSFTHGTHRILGFRDLRQLAGLAAFGK
jgi:hypothetical protein